LTKKKERIADPRSLARNHTVRAIQTIAGIMDSGANEELRMRASDLLLQRGWGKPVQPVSGADGEGNIIVEIVQRVRGGREGK
jgi:hypothetical protein